MISPIRYGLSLLLLLQVQQLRIGSLTITQKINNVRMCDGFIGYPNAGAKIVACIADLPSTGGTADATGFEGNQDITTNICSGVSDTKIVTLKLGNANFRTTTTISCAAAFSIRMLGTSGGGSAGSLAAGTTFTWNGSNGGTVLLLDRVRDSEFANFNIIPGTGSIGIGIRVDHVNPPTGSLLSVNNRFKSITIGASTKGVQVGNTSNQNNSEMMFEDVVLTGPGTDGYYLNDDQSKNTRIFRGGISNYTAGVHMVQGSFFAQAINLASNGVDFLVDNALDTVTILGNYSENAGRFFAMSGGTGASFPVNLIGNQAQPNAVHADTIYLGYSATGPLHLIGNDFAGGAHWGTPTVNFGVGVFGGSTVLSRGNTWWREDIWGASSISQADVLSEGDIGINGSSIPEKIPTMRGTVSGSVTLSNGANNDIALTANLSGYHKISGPTGAFSVSGFTGGRAGYSFYLFNTTSQQMTIKNLSGSSSANQVQTLTGSDVVLRTGTSFASFQYDSALQKWLLTSYN